MAQHGITTGFDEFGLKQHLNLRMCQHLLRNGLGTGKCIRPHADCDMLCIFGQEQCLLCCRKSAANDKDLLSGKKLPVTGGTIGNTTPPKFGFSPEACHTGRSARCQQQAMCTECSLFRLHFLDRGLHGQCRYGCG